MHSLKMNFVRRPPDRGSGSSSSDTWWKVMPQDTEREYEKQKARKMRESMSNMASSSSLDQEPRVRFAVARSSNKSSACNTMNKNLIENILGPYEKFQSRDDYNSLLGVYQQPPTPVAPREPIHDPDSYSLPPPQSNIMPGAGSSSSSSKSSQRSLPSHQSSRNGTTRPPKALPSGHKPLHPPSHPSQHSQTRNDEVKGNLKSGPSSGPGDGGGNSSSNKFTAMGKPPNLPPLKLPPQPVGTGAGGTVGESDDPILQRIRSEMLVKNPPVSAIIQTPRPEHHDGGPFAFNPITPIKDTPVKVSSSSKSRRGDDPSPKFNKPSDGIGALKNPKALDSWNVKGDLPLSEESEDDDQVGTNDNSSRLQSSAGGSSNAKALVSPVSGGKTSEDSSSEDDSTDDSELSSNNSTEDEQPASEPSSPKGDGGDKSTNHWKLENFIPPRKIKSPSSQETVTPGPTDNHAEDDAPVAEKSSTQSQRRRRTSKATKNTSSSHRVSRHTRDSDDSSDVGESHPRPTPRVHAEVRTTQKTRQSKTKPQRRVTTTRPDTDSDSDSDRPTKSDSNQSTVTSSSSSKDSSRLPEKSRKSGDSTVSRESNTRRTPKKKSESKNDSNNQNGAKHETVKLKPRRGGVKSRGYISCDSDSESDTLIDVVNTTPVKQQPASQRNTPSRTPKELSHISSPVKVHQSSPHVSPMPTSLASKNSSRRTPLSETQSSEPLTNGKSEDLFGRIQGNSEKGPAVSAAEKESSKKGRERDSVEKDSRRKGKAHQDTNSSKKTAGSSCNSSSSSINTSSNSSSSVSDGKDRSKVERSKGVSESSPLDNRLRPSVSPLVDKSSESPIVSPEPKVPISQLHHDVGSRKFTCSIPFSLIDKVPNKPNVNSVSCKLKSEIKEEVVDKKEVLDNRTTGKWAKGKRKTGDPNSKESITEDNKAKVISSIFRRRPDSENDSEKVKKEPKTEPIDSDSDNDKVLCKPPDIKAKDEESEGFMAQPSSLSDSSTSRPHRKKRDTLSERSPSSHDRKKARCNSERLAPEYSSINSVGETNSLDSCDVSSRLRGVESDHGTSRKRDRERDSSLESTRSSTHSESGKSSKKSRNNRSKEAKDSSMKSPSIKPGSQRETSSRSFSQEKEVQKSPYPQKSTQSTQQSSQYSQKGYSGGMSEDGVRNHETEYVNEEVEEEEEEEEEECMSAAAATTVAPNTAHQGYYGKVKAEESHTTPGGDNGYHHSRPASEHESTSDAPYPLPFDRPGEVGEAAKSKDQPDSGNMIPPQPFRQASGSAIGSMQPFMDPAALECYYRNLQKQLYPSYDERKIAEYNVEYRGFLNKAKDLKHTADAEKDRSVQVMKYLEAALYFILSGQGMENDPNTEAFASLRIYKDTLKFIRYVSSIFIREKKEGNLDNRLIVLSLRCQSLLSLKIHKMQRLELKDVQRQLTNYVASYSKHGVVETSGSAANATSWGAHRTTRSPSHLSQTPSPAGSVGSEGSQSSGYTTSTEGTRPKGTDLVTVGQTPPHPQPPSSVPVPQNIHSHFIKYQQLSGHLVTAHELWFEADQFVHKYDMQEFFIEMDRLVTPLTLHSSLSELVYYVQCGLQRLKE